MSALRTLRPDGTVRLIDQGPCRPEMPPFGTGLGGRLAVPVSGLEEERLLRQAWVEKAARKRARRGVAA